MCVDESRLVVSLRVIKLLVSYFDRFVQMKSSSKKSSPPGLANRKKDSIFYKSNLTSMSRTKPQHSTTFATLLSTRYHNDSMYWLFHLINNPLLVIHLLNVLKKFVATTSFQRFLFLEIRFDISIFVATTFKFDLTRDFIILCCICRLRIRVVRIAYIRRASTFISPFSQQTSPMDGDKKRSAFCLQITYYNMRGTLNPECLKICSQYHHPIQYHTYFLPFVSLLSPI